MMFRRQSISPNRTTQEQQQQLSTPRLQRNFSSSSLQDKTSFFRISFVFLCCLAAYSVIHQPSIATNLDERRTTNQQPFVADTNINVADVVLPLNDKGKPMSGHEFKRWQREQNIKRKEEKKRLREEAVAAGIGTMSPREARRWERQQNIKRKEEKKEARKLKEQQQQQEAKEEDAEEKKKDETEEPLPNPKMKQEKEETVETAKVVVEAEEEETPQQKKSENDQDHASKAERKEINHHQPLVVMESPSKTLRQQQQQRGDVVGVSVTSDATPPSTATTTNLLPATMTTTPPLPVVAGSSKTTTTISDTKTSASIIPSSSDATTATTTTTTTATPPRQQKLTTTFSPPLPSINSVGITRSQLPVNSTFNQQHKLLDLTRICRIENPTPTFGRPTMDLTESFFQGMGLTFRYQCDGPNYDKFTDTSLLPLIRRKQRRESSTFGTRPTIVPSNSNFTTTDNNNKSINILVVGNSHMRQIIVTLMCQYREQHLETRHYSPPEVEEYIEAVNRQYIFALTPYTNLTLTLFINHPVLYTGDQWQNNVEHFLPEGQKMKHFDAVVMGQFNPYKEIHKHTKLWQSMLSYDRLYPSHGIDLIKNRRAVLVEQMLDAYDGPIVYMSSMAVYDTRRYKNAALEMERHNKKTGRVNCQYINARDHLETPEINGYQCTSSSSSIIGDCTNGSGSHRCTGKKGGEPDLVAHELVQKLWNIFG